MNGTHRADATAETPPPTSVLADDPAAERCPYCDRPLATDRLLAIHVGESHPESCTDAERDAYDAALQDEDDDLFIFHLKVVGGLMTLWAGFIITYMVVLGIQG